MKSSVLRTSILSLVALGLLSACWSAPIPRAQITSHTGTVKTQRAGRGPWLVVRTAAHKRLYAGDHLITGETAKVRLLIDGARLELGPRTHVIIPPPPAQGKPSQLRLLWGKVWSWIVSRPNVEIVTAGAIASAEGTQFALEAAESGFTTLTVYEGLVRFHNELGQVVVGANEQSTAAPGQAPTRPMRVDPSGALQWEASMETIHLDLEMRFLPGLTREQLMTEISAMQPPDETSEASAWLKFGDLNHDLGEYTVAEEAYRAALKADPGNPEAELRLGACLLGQNRSAEALQVFEKWTKSPQYGATALAGAAAAYLIEGAPSSLAQARASVAAACVKAPGDPLVQTVRGVVALRSGDLEEANLGLSEAVRIAPDLYQAHAYRSSLLLLSARPEEALASARIAVQLAPGSALAQQSLATAQFYAGDLAGAKAAAEAALEIDPDSAAAQLVLADTAAASGDLDAAYVAAQAAVALDPQDARAWSTLGMLSLARNDLKVAKKAYTRAAELSATLAGPQAGLGMVYARQGKLARAIALQKASIALDPGSAGAHNNLGAVYLATGNLDEAVSEFRQASTLQPTWGMPHANLAIAYLDLNRFAEALREAETAVQLGERSARAYTTLARVYLEQDRTNKAWAALRKAVELDSDYALAHLQLAEVYNRLERPRDALKEQREGLRLQPSAILETREYSRTELRLEAGSFAGNLKTDGRGDEGQNAYYLNVAHEDDDWDRRRSDWERTDILGIAGRQDAPERTQALIIAAQSEDRDRPGAELRGGVPEDADFNSKFDAFAVDYLATRPISECARMTLRLGYSDAQLEDKNPDSLLGDPKSLRRLDTRYTALAAEARFDAMPSRHTRLAAGVSVSDEQRRLSGLITSRTNGARSYTPFANREDTDGGTAYLEHEWLFDNNTRLMVGGRMVARDGMDPVWRPKAQFVKPMGSSGTLVLLTHPIFRDDISALAPVDHWALREMSPLDLATGGFSQSYELQYQLTPVDGSLVRAGIYYRDAENLIVDLADPAWAAGEASTVLASGTTRGAEIEWEKWIGRNLSAGIWARYTDSENDAAGGLEIPYQPEIAGIVRLDYIDENGYRIGANWTYIGKRYADLANTVELDSFDFVNLRVARQLDLHTDLFVHVENLLDSDRAFWLNYPARGRDVRAGIEYRF
ncbi:MAG: TonB-dependent receptor [Armatimonadetes bacterium]|nr:TonB-dependent receptor [Armatimonadota bacterium]